MRLACYRHFHLDSFQRSQHGIPLSAQAITLTGARIWDGSAGTYLEDADAIRIVGRRIAAVGDAATLSSGCSTRDVSGLTIIPGLIDAHVHLCLDPDNRAVPEQGEVADETMLPAMRARAEAMVRAGITTARDLGGGRWLELAVRDEINAGSHAGPRLLCAGQPITSPGGHCHFWGGESATLEEALTVLDRQIERGADLIKVMATGGNVTPGSDPTTTQFDTETIAAIVERAGTFNRHVAAHCHGTAGIANAAAAGVATIEHCSWWGEARSGSNYDPDVASDIAARGIWVSPTVNAGWQRFLKNTALVERVQANYRAMRQAGVKLIASTDAGIPGVYHHQLAQALPVFAHYAGLSPLEALRAATGDAATAIGLGDSTGRIEKGYAADLLFVEGDPLTNLAVLTRPVAVMAAGRLCLDLPT